MVTISRSANQKLKLLYLAQILLEQTDEEHPLTVQDLIAQLKDQPLGERLLLPQNMLRAGEEVFLDDVTLEELKKTLQVPVDIVKSSGQDFVNCMLR